MTWTRVATAAVLIPFVVGLVVWGSTAWVALALALVVVLALFEYFSLGDAIGHRAYRFWTATCALLLVYVQWLTAIEPTYQLAGGLSLHREIGRFAAGLLGVPEAFFVFVLGVAVLTLWTKRPLAEGLPAAGISSSGLLLVAFPLTFAVRLHGLGKHPFAPHLSAKKTWAGAIASFVGSLLVGLAFTRWLNAPPVHLLAMAAVGNIAGQVGDLLESAYKRSAGVKDSGGMLPGHGGILDRIDALILAIPVVWFYWTLFYSPGM